MYLYNIILINGIIIRAGTQRDVIPSIQALINCGHAGSCNGGDSNAANVYVYQNGIPDVTCQQYQAKNMECSDINMCMNCDHDTGNCCKSTIISFTFTVRLPMFFVYIS